MLNRKTQLGTLEGPLLIFGGPYSNLQATQAIKKAAEDLGIPAGNTICTGDIIAYCGNPAETLELIRDWGIHLVMGNCEEALGSGAPDCGCGFDEGTSCSRLAVDWYAFASKKINVEQQIWLRELPSRIELTYADRRIAIVHGGLDRINRFIFASTSPEEKKQQLALAQAEIVIGGHTGIPFGQRLADRAWLNSGAIGMPANDGTRDGWYMLLDEESSNLQVSWHRLVYDAEAAAEEMRVQGLADGYQNALLNGFWPSMDVLPGAERKQQGISRPPLPMTL